MILVLFFENAAIYLIMEILQLQLTGHNF